MPSPLHRTGVAPSCARFFARIERPFADQVPDIDPVPGDHGCTAEGTDEVNRTGSYSDKK